MGKLVKAWVISYILVSVLFSIIFLDEILRWVLTCGFKGLPNLQRIKLCIFAVLTCLCVWELYATSILITATYSNREKQAIALAKEWKRKSLLPYFAMVAFIISVMLGGILLTEAYGAQGKVFNGMIEEDWIGIHFTAATSIWISWPFILGRIDDHLAAEFRKEK